MSAPAAAATTTAPSYDQLQTYTKEQLKNECRKRGQKTSGTKTELVCMNWLLLHRCALALSSDITAFIRIFEVMCVVS